MAQCYSQNVNFPLSWALHLLADVTIKFLFIAENYVWIKEAIKIFQYILTYNKSYILSDFLTAYGLKI